MKNFLKIILFLSFAIVFLILTLRFIPTHKEEKSEEAVMSGDVTKSTIVNITTEIKMLDLTFRVYPEKRHPATGNWSTITSFKVIEPGNGATLYQISPTTSSAGIGVITPSPSETFPNGNKIIQIKGYSHLARNYSVFLSDQHENLDFTPYGDLLAGDTHSANDNLVNSLDISTSVNELNTNNYKNDLNQDQLVNSLDLSILFYNIGQSGDA